MDTARTGFFSISPARLTALIAVLLLMTVIGWNTYSRPSLSASSTATTSPETQDSNIGASDALAEIGNATSSILTPLGTSIVSRAILAYNDATKNGNIEAGKSAVQALGASIDPGVQYKTYAAGDIKTDPNTSKDRVISYRADLRTALAPLLENKEYELDLFASYVDTKNPLYLQKLRDASANYRLAIANTEKVIAPADAASYQAGILTALSQFASALDALTENAVDPIASAALLKTYLSAQDNMVSSFNAIAKYASQKIL